MGDPSSSITSRIHEIAEALNQHTDRLEQGLKNVGMFDRIAEAGMKARRDDALFLEVVATVIDEYPVTRIGDLVDQIESRYEARRVTNG